jgi:hypothetical protein
VKRYPILPVLVGGLGGAWFLIVTVQFLQRGHWTMAVLTGAATVGLLWLAREEFLKQLRQ